MIDHRLRTFLTVCQYMNYTKAAKALFITQPAVSQHIRGLEKEFGVSLFSYSGKTLTLTAAGKLLLKKASAMQNDEVLLKDALLHAGSGIASYRFGVTTTIGEFVIARPLARFLRARPDINIQMSMGNTEELLGGLRDGSCHFALVEGYFPEEEFACRVYSTEDFIPVCSASHTFSRPPERMSDLLCETLILREPGSGTRDILERALKLHNIPLSSFSRVTELNSMYAIVQLLLEDCGISFLYKTAVLPYLREGRLQQIPLRDFRLQHDFSFLWQKGSVFSAEYEEIFTHLREGG
ncbi:MAG TPA: LysR family transcriptional regulator [Candidatus Anaerobutyricum avicola]|nr:LysR family transcriptional regulator [Candidatus Anaerobutyricum avicola]